MAARLRLLGRGMLQRIADQLVLGLFSLLYSGAVWLLRRTKAVR